MIFKTPPSDPWNAVNGESEYIVWAIEEDEKAVDRTDSKCTSVAKKFSKKTFIKIKISAAKSFAEKYELDQPQTAVRILNGKVVWKKLQPSSMEISDEAKLLHNRIGPKNLVAIKMKHVERAIKSGKADPIVNKVRQEAETAVEKMGDEIVKKSSDARESTAMFIKSIEDLKNYPPQTFTKIDHVKPLCSTMLQSPNNDNSDKELLQSSRGFFSRFSRTGVYKSFGKAKTSTSNMFRRMSFRKPKRENFTQNTAPKLDLSPSPIKTETQSTTSRSSSINSQEKVQIQQLPKIQRRVDVFMDQQQPSDLEPKPRQSRCSYFNFDDIKPASSYSQLYPDSDPDWSMTTFSANPKNKRMSMSMGNIYVTNHSSKSSLDISQSLNNKSNTSISDSGASNLFSKSSFISIKSQNPSLSSSFENFQAKKSYSTSSLSSVKSLHNRHSKSVGNFANMKSGSNLSLNSHGSRNRRSSSCLKNVENLKSLLNSSLATSSNNYHRTNTPAFDGGRNIGSSISSLNSLKTLNRRNNTPRSSLENVHRGSNPSLSSVEKGKCRLSSSADNLEIENTTFDSSLASIGGLSIRFSQLMSSSEGNKRGSNSSFVQVPSQCDRLSSGSGTSRATNRSSTSSNDSANTVISRQNRSSGSYETITRASSRSSNSPNAENRRLSSLSTNSDRTKRSSISSSVKNEGISQLENLPVDNAEKNNQPLNTAFQRVKAKGRVPCMSILAVEVQKPGIAPYFVIVDPKQRYSSLLSSPPISKKIETAPKYLQEDVESTSGSQQHQ